MRTPSVEHAALTTRAMSNVAKLVHDCTDTGPMTVSGEITGLAESLPQRCDSSIDSMHADLHFKMAPYRCSCQRLQPAATTRALWPKLCWNDFACSLMRSSRHTCTCTQAPRKVCIFVYASTGLAAPQALMHARAAQHKCLRTLPSVHMHALALRDNVRVRLPLLHVPRDGWMPAPCACHIRALSAHMPRSRLRTA